MAPPSSTHSLSPAYNLLCQPECSPSFGSSPSTEGALSTSRLGFSLGKSLPVCVCVTYDELIITSNNRWP